jgi:ATP-dependent DNA ligase
MKLQPPLEPMEAETLREIPEGGGWLYEPKWDGFRCIAFKNGNDVYLQSRNLKPLARYFPDVVEIVRSLPEDQLVLDGEIVVPFERRLDFERLQLRLHPAASRVMKLAAETPAAFVVFDLLADTRRKSLLNEPLEARRDALEKAFRDRFAQVAGLRLSPATRDAAMARQWLAETNFSLDGVVAKVLSMPYPSGQRTGMRKVKNYRSADCVVGGFRMDKSGKHVASLLLGLYDPAGKLNHVGFVSGLKNEHKPTLTQRLLELEGPPGFTGSPPGGPSRWNPEGAGEYHMLPHELVVEVEYDHFSGGRFRHGTSLQRWRTDKEPAQCTDTQIHFASDLPFELLVARGAEGPS